ncbi:putative RING-H2 finger protein ATL37 [Nicotiana tabacum]|uniref:RING-type E3 ubiquitin transferase n=2 Tax=Nicotiana TaxID=4085 RepID=A0A1S3X6S5_TOBAC|nr:PREDICTED: putative RING-H2 finger protein ATL37 [Nicotiana sylvestris]XP_016435690.1 PREDICTED: putative RING-H2 finger protein ATL37 [Nicotiana tabacum]
MKHSRNLFCFLLCLFCVMSKTGTVSATRPLNSNVGISPTLAILLACLVLLLMAVIFIYIRRMSPDSFDESMGFYFFRHRPVSRGLEPNIIETLPVFVYSDVKALKIGKSILECAVCLNEFEDEDTLRLLPNCCHVFHPECIDAWLAFRTTCPVCRANLKTKPAGKLQESIQETDDVESQNVSSVVSHPAPEEVINQSSQTPPVHSHTPDKARSKTPDFRHLAPKSTPRRPKIFGMFSRSHSTGHSLIQPGENCERFTLRLPDDVRKRLVDLSLSRAYNGAVAFSPARNSTKGYRFEPEEGRLSLSRAYNGTVAFSPARSSTKGYRCEPADGRLSKLRFLPTPPMFSRSGSSKGEKQPKSLLKSVKSVKSPLNLFCVTEKDDTGERSFTYLRSSSTSS